jgi:hypothetical protein
VRTGEGGGYPPPNSGVKGGAPGPAPDPVLTDISFTFSKLTGLTPPPPGCKIRPSTTTGGVPRSRLLANARGSTARLCWVHLHGKAARPRCLFL